MEFIFLTLNPEFITPFFEEGIIKKAVKNCVIKVKTINFREFAVDKHNQVDDTPYGGGSGMVLKPEPVIRCLENLELKPKHKIIITSPSGKKYNSKVSKQLTDYEQLILLCGRYEGIDERIVKWSSAELISIGDYVLSNGELASLIIFNSVVRLIPGVLGNINSLNEESFNNGLLEYAHYTKPRSFRGMKVPETLMSGNHKLISEWRKKSSIKRTEKFRSDLLYSNKKEE